MKKMVLLGLGLVLVIAVAVAALLYRPTAAPMAPPASAPAAPAPASPAKPLVPADCLRPGPAPVPPQGSTATARDMQLGHDAIQHFVEQLEAYQACRNAQIDHAAPGVTDKQKQAWLDEGNSAVDEANAVAGAFAVQLKWFKAKNPDAAVAGATAAQKR